MTFSNLSSGIDAPGNDWCIGILIPLLPGVTLLPACNANHVGDYLYKLNKA
jgi:hypothetical protein